MLIVKPYGRSHTRLGAAPKNGEPPVERFLARRDPAGEHAEISQFCTDHLELVIAQWISVIDKIATKPKKGGATDQQRELRTRLGAEAWKALVARGCLPPDLSAEDRSFADHLWAFKIHPYGDQKYRPSKGKDGKPNKPPSPKGRWYERFAGVAAPNVADVKQIANGISSHLYEGAFRLDPSLPVRRQGHIAQRAKSIETSAPKRGHVWGEWSADDEVAYQAAGDVARTIKSDVRDLENGRNNGHKRRVGPEVAAARLFEHWSKLFRDEEGRVRTAGEIKAEIEWAKIEGRTATQAGLFNLHMAIKEVYRRILKRHHKGKKPSPGQKASKVSSILPSDADALMRMIGSKRTNTELASLVRLGKVIHYTASEGAPDSPSAVISNWPKDVSTSRFRISDGQAEIKRNEAFVRVWRHIIVFASRTVKNWADPKDLLPDKDILMVAEQVVGRNHYAAAYMDPQSDAFAAKMDLLFGKRSNLFSERDDAFRKALLRSVIDGVYALRNRSFHFTGLGGFLAALSEVWDAAISKARHADGSVSPEFQRVLSNMKTLWQEDRAELAGRLKKTLTGAHAGHYFDERKCKALYGLLTSPGPGSLPLPRFGRVLTRSLNAWKRGDALGLPDPANRLALENPARHCQYTLLKLIYEGPFRSWIEAQTEKQLNGWIDTAIAHTTEAAHKMNFSGKKDDPHGRAVIAARAATIPKPTEQRGLRGFFFDLTAETASEMRVQRGYGSDANTARKQAGYIDDLLCDVLALAFRDYLPQVQLEWLRDLPHDKPLSSAEQFDIAELPDPIVERDVEDWQAFLYVFAHLVPVDEIGKLLHQLRKWEILAGRESVQAEDEKKRLLALQKVLELYLGMHDAKFEGGAALSGCTDFAALFESETGFQRMFPAEISDDEDKRLPRRGLREIMRFGHLPALEPLFARVPIFDGEIDDYQRDERKTDGVSPIAKDQRTRQKLHDGWSEKRSINSKDLQDYVEALQNITLHRRRSTHVTLTNHVRVHRLMVSVLGRLVDFSGLWERDLYFVTLAIMHNAGLDPSNCFEGSLTDERTGLYYLGNGQILFALQNLKELEAPVVKRGVSKHFGEVWVGGNRITKIRNDFAHLNMLKPERGADGDEEVPLVDLTEWVNNSRKQMAYDRKLKNAVSQSIIELLGREGLKLTWDIENDDGFHAVTRAKIGSGLAPHLGKAKLHPKPTPSDPRPRWTLIQEAMHDQRFLDMVAELFAGKADRVADITAVELASIDWSRQNQPHGSIKGGKNYQRPKNRRGKG